MEGRSLYWDGAQLSCPWWRYISVIVKAPRETREYSLLCWQFLPLENDIDGLVQERRDCSALATELRLSCNNPSNLRCLMHKVLPIYSEYINNFIHVISDSWYHRRYWSVVSLVPHIGLFHGNKHEACLVHVEFNDICIYGSTRTQANVLLNRPVNFCRVFRVALTWPWALQFLQLSLPVMM